QLGERDTVLVAQIVGRQFAPARLYAVIRDDFRRRVDQQQLDAIAVWFRSPLGRRITALEIAAANPDAAPRIAAFAAGLKTSPAPSYGRIAHSALLRVVREVADRTAFEVLRAVPPQRWAATQRTAGPSTPR